MISGEQGYGFLPEDEHNFGQSISYHASRRRYAHADHLARRSTCAAVEQRADHRPAASFLSEIDSRGRQGTRTQLDRTCRPHWLDRMAQMDEFRFQSKSAQVAAGIHNSRWDPGAL